MLPQYFFLEDAPEICVVINGIHVSSAGCILELSFFSQATFSHLVSLVFVNWFHFIYPLVLLKKIPKRTKNCPGAQKCCRLDDLLNAHTHILSCHSCSYLSLIVSHFFW